MLPGELKTSAKASFFFPPNDANVERPVVLTLI